jgi:hypothetical protein
MKETSARVRQPFEINLWSTYGNMNKNQAISIILSPGDLTQKTNFPEPSEWTDGRCIQNHCCGGTELTDQIPGSPARYAPWRYHHDQSGVCRTLSIIETLNLKTSRVGHKESLESGSANRLYYMAIPPSVFPAL